MDFFKDSLVEVYEELARHCDIPKTCFALLKAIDENPDSPYINNCFYLQSKARYFYEHFIIPVGEIINAMRTKELRDKFATSYKKKSNQYKEDANL